MGSSKDVHIYHLLVMSVDGDNAGCAVEMFIDTDFLMLQVHAKGSAAEGFHVTVIIGAG